MAILKDIWPEGYEFVILCTEGQECNGTVRTVPPLLPDWVDCTPLPACVACGHAHVALVMLLLVLVVLVCCVGANNRWSAVPPPLCWSTRSWC